jgi:peptidoglycan/LPS O-acetylase OafA/YrhL
MSDSLPSRNNFDLIRLLAALQVCVSHTMTHLKIDIKIPVIYYFPGVLIFFTVSGFLIYDSFCRNQDLKRYFINRFLRIYPAIWICFMITIFLLLIFKVITPSEIISPTMLKWVITQMTIFQFWTPDLLRIWGTGSPNGSLWTIPVEIQFYISIPVIFLLFKKIKIVYKLILLFLVSVLFNFFLGELSKSENLVAKLLRVSLLPYLLYFLVGIFIREYWVFIKTWFINKFLYWILLFFVFIYFFDVSPLYYPSDFLGYICNLLVAFVTISFAYSQPKFNNLLKDQDISYGIYLYHMLIVNILVHLGLTKDVKYFFMSILFTVIVASISWNYIEKIVLRLKIN